MSDMYGLPRRRLVGEAWFWILVGIASIVVVAAIVFGIRWVTASPRGQLQAREQIQSGRNRIAAYDHFFDLCAQVQSDEATIRALKDEQAGGVTEERDTQINATITALRSGRAEKINRYNADARKDYTIGQFKSSQLPYVLDPTVEATTCVA